MLFTRHELSRLTTRLLVLAAVFSLAHHLDHVLRVDHSGWPFKPQVTPFTFSLLAYPMMAFALWGPWRFFWTRWTLLALGTAFTLYAHSALESPLMQYRMWADNCSADPAFSDVRNLLDRRSPTAGVLAVLVSMSLNLLAMAATWSMLVDGRRKRAAQPT
ncbi:hypothetical protein [Xylophilus sp. GOD-11R]|uniref:hypothetical protein n=1 Tax=Xylophilus sp. GOD-11R TaxID=3089814 RepID=UPI00298C15F2|nr:hypothetical protein [Xylophilus sp. GOD-11R]WPB59108.1 hypothetical protein R9X41_10885 [Xylophilus sp. GOD-11R]